MSDTVRVVAIADTHLFTDDLPPLPDGDLLVHAGDLCRAGTLKELQRALSWFTAQPHRQKLMIAGNHDRCFEDDPDSARALVPDDVVYLQDSGATVAGLRIWGSPWQPAFNDWAFNLPRGKPLAERWALIPEDTDLLITHGPPQGIGDQNEMTGRQGCAALRAVLARVRPLLNVFGHIHQDGGYWVRDGVAISNVTTWECERPASVFDIDPTRRRVTPVQIPTSRGELPP